MAHFKKGQEEIIYVLKKYLHFDGESHIIHSDNYGNSQVKSTAYQVNIWSAFHSTTVTHVTYRFIISSP